MKTKKPMCAISSECSARASCNCASQNHDYSVITLAIDIEQHEYSTRMNEKFQPQKLSRPISMNTHTHKDMMMILYPYLYV